MGILRKVSANYMIFIVRDYMEKKLIVKKQIIIRVY